MPDVTVSPQIDSLLRSASLRVETGTPAVGAAGDLVAISPFRIENARVTAANADRTGLYSDRLVAFTGLTAARTYTLPLAVAVNAGCTITVYDEDYLCSWGCPIVVTPSGADTIGGATASHRINLRGGWMTLVSDGADNWQVISSATPSGILAPYGPRRDALAMISDMNIPANNTGFGEFLVANNAGSGTVARGKSPGRPGIVDLTSAGGGFDRASLQLGFGSLWRCEEGFYDFFADAAVIDAPTAGEDHRVFMGLNSAVDINGAEDAVGFMIRRVNSTVNWMALCAKGFVLTFVDTGVAYATTAFKRFAFSINSTGTSVEFFIDGVSVATITTNIPANLGDATKRIGTVLYIDRVGGTTANRVPLRIDRCGIAVHPNTPRS